MYCLPVKFQGVVLHNFTNEWQETVQTAQQHVRERFGTVHILHGDTDMVFFPTNSKLRVKSIKAFSRPLKQEHAMDIIYLALAYEGSVLWMDGSITAEK